MRIQLANPLHFFPAHPGIITRMIRNHQLATVAAAVNPERLSQSQRHQPGISSEQRRYTAIWYAFRTGDGA